MPDRTPPDGSARTGGRGRPGAPGRRVRDPDEVFDYDALDNQPEHPVIDHDDLDVDPGTDLDDGPGAGPDHPERAERADHDGVDDDDLDHDDVDHDDVDHDDVDYDDLVVDDGTGGTPRGPRGGRTGRGTRPGGLAAGRPQRTGRAGAPPVASRAEAVRAFLSSGTGGALVAVAAVLLIVATLLAVHGQGGGESRTAAQSPSRPGSGQPASPSHQGGSAPATGTGTGPAHTTGGGSPSHSAAPSHTPRPSAGHPGTRPAGGHPSRPALTVLNNTTVHNLAHDAAGEFHRAGWPIALVGGFTGRIPVTTVYFTPGNAAEERAAKSLAASFPRITRVLPRYEGLPPDAHGVIVVLAPDWQG